MLDDVPREYLVAQLVDRIAKKRPDLLTQNFAFYKNNDCTEECDLTDLVSSLGTANNVYRVYILAVPVAGE